MRDHGRVSRAANLVPTGAELRPEGAEVVELAVEDRDDVAALVRDRLRARREIDDPEALMAEHEWTERLGAPLVRPAMAEPRPHRVDERERRRASRCIEPADPTHTH